MTFIQFQMDASAVDRVGRSASPGSLLAQRKALRAKIDAIPYESKTGYGPAQAAPRAQDPPQDGAMPFLVRY